MVEQGAATETSRSERALKDLRPIRVFHPILLALIPLCGNYAYGENAGLLPVSALARPAAVLVCLALGLWLLFTSLVHNKYHGGLLASAVIVPLFVVWGVLEEAIRAVIPVFESRPPAMSYFAIVAIMIVMVAVVAHRHRANPAGLRKALTGLIALFLITIAVTTFALAPIFGRRAAWLIVGYVLAAAFGVRAVWRYQGDYQAATRSLNWFATILLVLYGAVLAVNRPSQPHVTPPALPIATAAKDVPVDRRPDIYLIALDGYARSDVLRTAYHYNNLSFEQEMNVLGFYSADQSIANYPQSVLSLTALLNADYLSDLLPDQASRDKATMSHVFAFYHDNSVFNALRGLGYRIASFSPGLESLEPRRKDVERIEPGHVLGEFEMVLLDRTFASRVMQAYFYARYQNPAYWRYSFRRTRIEYAFDQISRLATESNPSPRLVFANLLIPEPPYLFTRTGGRAQPFGPGSLAGDRSFRGLESEFREAYLDQVFFTNQKLIQTAKGIIEHSKRPTVIIVLSGRGAPPVIESQPTPPRERFENLLMVRFPNGKNEKVVQWRDTLSLVNVFRVVLNETLNADLPLLEDKTYVSDEDTPFLAQPAPL